MENARYFKVLTKCGHVGKQYYIPITFAVMARDGKEAADKARFFPRVKHHHKDAILDVEEITFEEHEQIIEINDNDPYLKCTSIQDQNLYCDLTDRLVLEPRFEEEDYFEKKHKKQRRIKIKTDWGSFSYDDEEDYDEYFD